MNPERIINWAEERKKKRVDTYDLRKESLEDEKDRLLHNAYERVKVVMKKVIIGGMIASLPIGEVVNLAYFAKDRSEWNSEGEYLANREKEAEAIFGEYCKFVMKKIEREHVNSEPKIKGFLFEYLVTKHVVAAETEGSLAVVDEDIPIEYNIKLERDHSINKETIEEICARAYPKRWTEGMVLDWKEEDEEGVPSEYGIGGDASGAYYRDKRMLELYGKLGSFFNAVLSHEIAHGNDWESSSFLSASDRLDLLLEIAGRIKSNNRYNSSYVERINNPDKKKETYLKAVEYWAEICEQFFTDPTQLPAEDFAIVSKVISITDPDFDIGKFQDSIKDIVIKNYNKGE